MGDPLRLAVVEDDTRFRTSLETLFGHASGFDLAKSFGSASRLLEELDALRWQEERPPWDLVLMDLELPGTSGIEATRRLKERFPALKVVILTVFEAPETVMQAICAGADGYLLKRQAGRELLAELRAVEAGGAPLTAGVARTVMNLLRHRAGPEGGAPEGAPSRLDLTGREQEVLRALARGLSYKQVAAELDVAIDTMRSHVRSVYDKLQVHSVAEAVSRALREGLV